MLTKKQVREAKDKKRIKVPLPEWAVEGQKPEDAFLYVGTISGKRRDEFEASLVKMKKKGAEITMDNMRARLVVMAAENEDGTLYFDEEDAGWLGEKAAAPVDRLYTSAKDLAGMTDNDLEELKKTLNKIPSDDSSSG